MARASTTTCTDDGPRPAVTAALSSAESNSPSSTGGAGVSSAPVAGVWMVALVPPVDGVLLRYVNRLSDLLFVLARVANHRAGVEEVEW